ncbi:ParE-like toxin of type II toxin-antitoxin system [Nitrosomonas nitrosa]|uniref:ParE-like toxin of type II toxin-antitoxin system n=1 Tax=Nitrosomonas nitrosa TaxID=52442 RepID=A0A1I4SR36_9PROT|nr:type II toxin-antitoxin system RelE/ParE family toxin [Nitrosomonas nitrosa]SFM66881.1 ParE-like toxin of type II toxin-antitoxin system [Nitrosomonas nitrosa]
MRLLVTPTFERAVKKLHPKQKSELDEAVRTIVNHPECGEAKVGDLQGVRVYKFRLSNQLCMLAYRILDENSLKLLTFGPHENFYRDLKRQDK